MIISFITSYVIAEITSIDLIRFSNVFIMVLNGFLIYASAVGINAVTGRGNPPPPSGPGGGFGGGGGVAYKTKDSFETRAFLRSWF